MPVLLRLLLCLTLLANTVGGAWAAQGPGVTPVAKAHASGAMAAPPCHETAGGHLAAAPADAQPGSDHSSPAAGMDPHDQGCGSHGCNCLQHCAWSFMVSALPATALPRARVLLPGIAGGEGLPQPYQPVRPPIA